MQAVGEAAGFAGEKAFEEIPAAPLKPEAGLAFPQHLKVPRAGYEGAHDRSAFDDMQTEHREWVAVPRIGNPFYVLVSRSPVNPGHAFASPSLVLKRIAIRLAPA